MEGLVRDTADFCRQLWLTSRSSVFWGKKTITLTPENNNTSVELCGTGNRQRVLTQCLGLDSSGKASLE